MIALEGTIQTGSYQDKNYPDVTHYTQDVLVENVEFCGGKNDGGQQNTQQQERPKYNSINDVKSNQQINPTAQEFLNKAKNAGVDLSEFEDVLGDGEPPF